MWLSVRDVEGVLDISVLAVGAEWECDRFRFQQPLPSY